MVPNARSFTLEQLAILLEAKLVGRADLAIFSVADLETAGPTELSFFHNEKYRHALKKTRAGAVIAAQVLPELSGTCWLIHQNPSAAFQRALELLCSPAESKPYKGVHPSAVIDATAIVAPDVSIGPLAVIGPRSQIATGSYIGPGCLVGADVVIGPDCLLHPGVIIREGCQIGARVILQAGCVIGSCGFGYDTTPSGHRKLQQLGNVVIEEDVEVGAGSCVDRARLGSTRIKKGSKIDNLVMIGHGVQMGEHNLIVAQVGIAGSSRTGNWVVLGGQAGVAGHLTLEDQVMVAAQSGVTKNLATGRYGGTPALPTQQWHELQAQLRSVKELKAKVQELGAQLSALKSSLNQLEQ